MLINFSQREIYQLHYQLCYTSFFMINACILYHTNNIFSSIFQTIYLEMLCPVQKQLRLCSFCGRILCINHFEIKMTGFRKVYLLMNLCNIKTVKEIMAMFKVNFRKEFGQNFLTDESVVIGIAENCCDYRTNETILEIGPGIGTLTQKLAEIYKNVIAIEIDKSLIPVLSYTMQDYKNVTIINADVMKCDLASLLEKYMDGGVSVCANLPYYITTPILMLLIESRIKFKYITIMVQSEVADRLCASPEKGNNGAITTVLSYYGKAEIIDRVDASKFIPPPKVNSSVVRIKLYEQSPYHPKSEALMFRVIKAAYEQRRKTLPNAISASFPELSKEKITEIIVDCSHRSDIRGEKLSIADFVFLSDKFYDVMDAMK